MRALKIYGRDGNNGRKGGLHEIPNKLLSGDWGRNDSLGGFLRDEYFLYVADHGSESPEFLNACSVSVSFYCLVLYLSSYPAGVIKLRTQSRGSRSSINTPFFPTDWVWLSIKRFERGKSSSFLLVYCDQLRRWRVKLKKCLNFTPCRENEEKSTTRTRRLACRSTKRGNWRGRSCHLDATDRSDPEA